MLLPKTVWRCIHCGQELDEEKDQVLVKKTHSVPWTAIGDARLDGDSYREINVLHCQSCHEIESEMILFRNKTVIHYPLLVSIGWTIFFTLSWFISSFFSLQEILLPLCIFLMLIAPVSIILVLRPRIRNFLAREDLETVHRLALKDDYSMLLPLYLVSSSILVILFPVGLPLLLIARIYYYYQDKQGRIEKECFFSRISQQCKYCSGGTSFRRFRGKLVHYYRHSDNCTIFLRGWVA
ncbi:MAG: hypothetical protein ACXAEU_02470 [Candidatus Hodarchaeales archaeon]|jgi:hypothetical protein